MSGVQWVLHHISFIPFTTPVYNGRVCIGFSTLVPLMQYAASCVEAAFDGHQECFTHCFEKNSE